MWRLIGKDFDFKNERVEECYKVFCQTVSWEDRMYYTCLCGLEFKDITNPMAMPIVVNNASHFMLYQIR